MKLSLFAAGFAAIASARGILRNPYALRGATTTQKRPTYVYVDHWENALEHSDFISYIKDLVNAGASHVLLAFVVPGAGDALDSTGQYDRLTEAERAELKTFMAANNAKLIMSIGGGNYGTTFVSSDATATATKWCGYAAGQGYDGVDWDLEGFTARSKDHPEMQWIKTAVDVCHKYIGLVSHAPQAPNIGLFSNYAFEGVMEASTDPTDRFLIQYYNQPTAPYTDYASIFQSDREFLASLAEIEKRVPSVKGKLVLGKYMYGFGGTGEMSADALVSVLEQAEASGYNGGVMIWKSPAKGTPQLAQFLSTDLPKLAGVGAAPAPTAAPAVSTRVPAPVPTEGPHPIPTRAPGDETTPSPTRASSVSCAGVRLYDGSVLTTGGQTVYSGSLWRANWYAQNPPSTSDLAWTKIGDCDAPQSVPKCVASVWDATKIYATPTEVTYESGLYRNKWWSAAGERPSRSDENWVYLGECA